MRTFDGEWCSIVGDGEFSLHTVVRIYGATGNDTNGQIGNGYKEYATITAPIIARSLLSSDSLSIGNTNAGQLQFTIMTTDTIPKSAKIEVIGQVIDNERDELVSQRVPFGTFWISKRTVRDNLIDIEAYDAMMMGNQAYSDSSQTLNWPKKIKEVVKRIAYQMGVSIDYRTSGVLAEVGDYSVITKPSDDMTLLDILSNIGGLIGGNWIITDDNKLRFVPLTSAPTNDINGYLTNWHYSALRTPDGINLLWNGAPNSNPGAVNGDWLLQTTISPNGTEYGGPLYYRIYNCNILDDNGKYHSENAILSDGTQVYSSSQCTLRIISLISTAFNIRCVLVCTSNNVDSIGIGEEIAQTVQLTTQTINGQTFRYGVIHYINEANIIITESVFEESTVDIENGIISPEQLAYLALFSESVQLQDNDIAGIDVPIVIGSMNTANSYTVTKVTLTEDKDHVYTIGNDDGYEVIYSDNPYASQEMAQLLYNRIVGTTYAPFEATCCMYDPAVELGDAVYIGKDIKSILYNEKRTLNIDFRGDISAPGSDELENEYPFVTFEQKQKYTSDLLTEGIRQNRTEITQTQRNVSIIAEEYTRKDSVRSAFAIDPTNIILSAGIDDEGNPTGQVIFNSGTFIVNSNNFSVDSDGIMTARGAHLYSEGSETSVSGDEVEYYIELQDGQIIGGNKQIMSSGSVSFVGIPDYAVDGLTLHDETIYLYSDELAVVTGGGGSISINYGTNTPIHYIKDIRDNGDGTITWEYGDITLAHGIVLGAD